MAEYTPSYIAVKAPYVRDRGAEDMDGWRAGGAEFDRFLARVRRDAAREALDGYAAAEEESFLALHVKDAPIAAAQCTHAAITAREYCDTHYPEQED